MSSLRAQYFFFFEGLLIICSTSLAMRILFDGLFLGKKAPYITETHQGISGRSLVTSNLEIILYRTLQRLIGLKSSSLEAPWLFGIRMM